MKKYFIVILIISISLFLFSCNIQDPDSGDSGDAGDGGSSEGNIYISGYHNDGTNDIATFWNDTGDGMKQNELDNGHANSIYVQGTDVYVAGYYTNGTTDTPVYWKNDTRVDLPLPATTSYFFVKSIFVDQSNVYVTGYYYDTSLSKEVLIYWIDDGSNINYTVIDEGEACAGYQVIIKDTAMYILGVYVIYTPVNVIPTVWEISLDGSSTNKTDLIQPTDRMSYGLDMYIDSTGKIYIAGYTHININTRVAAYWTIEETTVTKKEITAGPDHMEAHSIYTDGTKIYLCGIYADEAPQEALKATYWTDDGTNVTEGTLVSDDTNPSGAYEIFYKDNTIYIAGFYNDGTKDIATLWEVSDDTPVNTDLSDASGNSMALEMYCE